MHRRRRRTELSHLLDEALDVRATKRADLPAPQQRVDVVLQRVLVAAHGLGLVRLAAAIEDCSGPHPGDQRDTGLADSSRRRRTQPATANRDNRLLLPRDRLGSARRPCRPNLATAGVTDLAAIVRDAVAALSAFARAVLCVTLLDAHRRPGTTSSGLSRTPGTSLTRSSAFGFGRDVVVVVTWGKLHADHVMST